MTQASQRDGIREAIGFAAGFHFLILLPSSMVLDGGELLKTAIFAMIPFWSMVMLIVWKRSETATRVDCALIKFLYPVLFGGYYMWTMLAAE